MPGERVEVRVECPVEHNQKRWQSPPAGWWSPKCVRCGEPLAGPPGTYAAFLTGRDALVMAVGRADVALNAASKARHDIDAALCEEQDVPFAPRPSVELMDADRKLDDALIAKHAAMTALRDFDRSVEGQNDG